MILLPNSFLIMFNGCSLKAGSGAWVLGLIGSVLFLKAPHFFVILVSSSWLKSLE